MSLHSVTLSWFWPNPLWLSCLPYYNITPLDKGSSSGSHNRNSIYIRSSIAKHNSYSKALASETAKAWSLFETQRSALLETSGINQGVWEIFSLDINFNPIFQNHYHEKNSWWILMIDLCKTFLLISTLHSYRTINFISDYTLPSQNNKLYLRLHTSIKIDTENHINTIYLKIIYYIGWYTIYFKKYHERNSKNFYFCPLYQFFLNIIKHLQYNLYP
jgi:hypothetical protein